MGGKNGEEAKANPWVLWGREKNGWRKAVHGERRLLELGARRRGGSGGVWVTRSGRLASWGRGKAFGGVCRGGAGLEWWGDGEGDLVGVDMGGGGVPRRRSGEKAKG